MKKNTKKEINEFLLESNHIEGVYDSDSFLQAQVAWDYLSKKKTLTLAVVLKTHYLLMINQNLQPDEKGFFRRCKIWIGGREGHDWIHVPDAMKNWIMNMNDIVRNGQGESKIFLERITKEHHVKYEKIHPFVDGNGRTGRMFMNWERMQVGLPIITIKAGWPDQKGEQANYYKCFK